MGLIAKCEVRNWAPGLPPGRRCARSRSTPLPLAPRHQNLGCRKRADTYSARRRGGRRGRRPECTGRRACRGCGGGSGGGLVVAGGDCDGSEQPICPSRPRAVRQFVPLVPDARRRPGSNGREAAACPPPLLPPATRASQSTDVGRGDLAAIRAGELASRIPFAFCPFASPTDSSFLPLVARACVRPRPDTHVVQPAGHLAWRLTRI